MVEKSPKLDITADLSSFDRLIHESKSVLQQPNSQQLEARIIAQTRSMSAAGINTQIQPRKSWFAWPSYAVAGLATFGLVVFLLNVVPNKQASEPEQILAEFDPVIDDTDFLTDEELQGEALSQLVWDEISLLEEELDLASL